MARRLSIRTSKSPAIIITRNAISDQRLVYLALANKRVKYPYGDSKIVYIGTSKIGVERMAESAADIAKDALKAHGIKQLTFNVVTSQKRQKVKTWAKLERALLIVFRQEFGEPPKYNTQGKKTSWDDERKTFSEEKLRKVIQQYS